MYPHFLASLPIYRMEFEGKDDLPKTPATLLKQVKMNR